MKKLILYGNTTFTKLLKWYIDNDTDRLIMAVTVEDKYIDSDIFEGLPVVSFSEIEKKYNPNEYEILICVGYSHMNNVRKKIFFQCKEKGYSIASYIHSTANIASNVSIGEGNIVLENTLIQPFVKLGDCNLLWYKIAIAHDCIIGNFNTIAGMSSISGFVEIGNNTFIGNNSTVRDSVKISNYTLLGAGSYIDKDTKSYDVYVPQRCIKLDKQSIEINL
ncbi:MAG: acetyltransferase [Lachnospiraceae bacterium]|jgi:sugar O-acyltransferase (sialic acid O-acetyltransferase NeuD family)|nr:acetyltransferase [Lachnospiraceae bacterium]